MFAAVAFNVKFGGDNLFNFSYIIVTNMSFIRTGMHGDSISTETLRIDGCFNYITASDAGNAAARISLAEMRIRGDGVPRAAEEGLRDLAYVARSGDASWTTKLSLS